MFDEIMYGEYRLINYYIHWPSLLHNTVIDDLISNNNKEG